MPRDRLTRRARPSAVCRRPGVRETYLRTIRSSLLFSTLQPLHLRPDEKSIVYVSTMPMDPKVGLLH